MQGNGFQMMLQFLRPGGPVVQLHAAHEAEAPSLDVPQISFVIGVDIEYAGDDLWMLRQQPVEIGHMAKQQIEEAL
ncbi:hypothetical protein D9M72_550780 [compost metagenome]